MQAMWMCLMKMTRAPSSLEQKKLPDKKNASFLPKQILPDKKNGWFSSGLKKPDVEFKSPPTELTGKRAIPIFMVLI